MCGVSSPRTHPLLHRCPSPPHKTIFKDTGPCTPPWSLTLPILPRTAASHGCWAADGRLVCLLPLATFQENSHVLPGHPAPLHSPGALLHLTLLLL